MKYWRAWFSLALIAFSILCLALLKPARAQDSVAHWLRRLQAGRPHVYRNLALYPVTGGVRHLPSRFTLDAAIREDVLRVQELHESGSVNRLTVENRGGRPVFVMAGEILSGAKQDRVLQHDLWLPAHSGKVQVAVFCVEHGRWTYRDRKTFDSKSTLSNTYVRAAARTEQSQGAVWKSVDETNRAGGVSAPTQSLSAVFEDPKLASQVSECARHFSNMVDEHPDMTGVIVQVGDRFTSIDLLADRELLKAMWPKLIRSYAVEARGGRWTTWEDRSIPLDGERAQEFLEEAARVEAREVSNVGEGRLFELSSSRFAGEALLLDEGPVHIDLFTRPRGSHVTPHPHPRPTTTPTPWPKAQDLIRPYKTEP